MLKSNLCTVFQDFIPCLRSINSLRFSATSSGYQERLILTITDSAAATYHHGQLHLPGPALQRGHHSLMFIPLPPHIPRGIVRVPRPLFEDSQRVVDLLLVHSMDNSFHTPLAFTSMYNVSFTRVLAIPWNIFPFSVFFYPYDFTCHVHTCIHGRILCLLNKHQMLESRGGL